MQAAKLYGAQDIRIEDVPAQAEPGPGQALIAITSVGICGSDLHTYEDGKIGSTNVESPVILGHEFAAEVLAVGPDAQSGLHTPLQPGQRVAVEPTVSCWHCEMCEKGHPNLCPNQYFLGLWPHDGALQERMIVEARNCFPVPDSISNATAVLLEPLGVAIHAVDLGKLKVANSVVVLGCGPIGLMIIKLAKMAGAAPIYAFDKFDWRIEKAKEWGATDAWQIDDQSIERINELTAGRGVDVVFEAAWAGEAVQQAAQISRLGGRLVLVGIPGEDKLTMQHSVARRKGLTIMMCRRMKHTYPRAIQLATMQPPVMDLEDLVSHRFPLSQANEAYTLNTDYAPGVHKIIIDVQPE